MYRLLLHSIEALDTYTRAARYEENTQCARTLLNIPITTLLVINKSAGGNKPLHENYAHCMYLNRQ